MTVETYCEALALCSAEIVEAVDHRDQTKIAATIRQAFTLTPPDGVQLDPAVALIVVLAAQILPTLSVETRLGWVTEVAV